MPVMRGMSSSPGCPMELGQQCCVPLTPGLHPLPAALQVGVGDVRIEPWVENLRILYFPSVKLRSGKRFQKSKCEV